MGENAGSNHGRHDLWLAMQAAYKRYVDASVPLNDLQEFADTQDRLLQQQRTAFEEYIDARLEFSESLLPRYAADTATVKPGEAASRSWIGVLDSRWVVSGFAVAALCLAALSLTLLMREHRPHAAGTVQKMSAQSGVGVPAVVLRSDWPIVIHASQPAKAVECREAQSQAPLPRENKRIGYAQTVRLQPTAKRIRYEFNLTFFPQFKSIGPFQASLRRINWKHDDFDISLRYGNFRFDKRHVRPGEPLWIRLGGRAKPFQLLIDRIGTGYVHGCLCDGRCEKQVLTPAPSPRTAKLELSSRAGMLFAVPAPLIRRSP